MQKSKNDHAVNHCCSIERYLSISSFPSLLTSSFRYCNQIRCHLKTHIVGRWRCSLCIVKYNEMLKVMRSSTDEKLKRNKTPKTTILSGIQNILNRKLIIKTRLYERNIFYYNTNNCLTAFLIYKYNFIARYRTSSSINNSSFDKKNWYKSLLLTNFIRFAWTFKLARSHKK